jgi:hypothetical protein
MPAVQINALMPQAASEMMFDCIPENGFGRLYVAFRAEPEVNRLTDALNRSIQVNLYGRKRHLLASGHIGEQRAFRNPIAHGIINGLKITCKFP